MSPNGSNLASAGRVLSQRNVNASGIIIDGAFGKNSAKVRERGYVEGQNLSIDVRWPQGTFEHDPRPVAELINSNVDVIVAWPAPAVNAARRATSAIPIVMAAVGDPLGLGFITSLSHPGGNITGLSTVTTDLSAKLMELFAELVPGMKRVGVVHNPNTIRA
jgi:putative ABC transport system substrate-binding protein